MSIQQKLSPQQTKALIARIEKLETQLEKKAKKREELEIRAQFRAQFQKPNLSVSCVHDENHNEIQFHMSPKSAPTTCNALSPLSASSHSFQPQHKLSSRHKRSHSEAVSTILEH